MAKPAIITISREQVERDIQREIDKGMTPVEAALCVQGHAEQGINQAKVAIDSLVREANGAENFNDDQKAKYDSLYAAIIEPETQRVGHCKNIIAELTKPK